MTTNHNKSKVTFLIQLMIDDILLICMVLSRQKPLKAGRDTCAKKGTKTAEITSFF